MIRYFQALLCLLLMLGSVVTAQTHCPTSPPAYELLRQNEDYSYLRDGACRQDRWDALKYVQLGSGEHRFLTIGGEIRQWYEGFRNADWGVGPQDDNGYLLSRLSVYGDLHLNGHIRIFAQLTSDVEAGRNGGPRPVIDESKLFFEQAFVDVTLKSEKKHTDEDHLILRVGRQEFHFGSGRLVDIREGPNVHRAFDGVALIWNKASWNVTGLAVKPVLNGTNFFDAPPEHGTTFWGVYAVRRLPKILGANIDLYYLGLDRKQAVFEKGVGREQRQTVGARFWGKRGGLDYNSEAVFQFGAFGGGSIRAWGNGHETGYTFRSVRFKPRVGVTASVTSGDNGNPNSALGTFSPLFPTGIYFGQGVLNLNGPTNIIQFDPCITLQITESLTIIEDNNRFWRTSLHDGVYGLATNLLVPGQGNPARYVGSQPSVGVHWNLDRHLTLSTAYAHFFAGPFLVKALPRRRSVDYAAVWATYKF